MNFCLKALACCTLSAAVVAAPVGSAQTASKRRIPADPVEVALDNLLTTAQAAMDHKDFQTAALNYQDYLAKKPDDALVHFDLGYALMSMQKLTDAKAEYEKAVSLDPQMGPAYLNLGLTLVDTDPASAVAPLQKALELNPNQPGAKFLLGIAFEKTHKLSEAIEQYQAAEALDGVDFDIHYALARILLSTGHAAEAEPEFRAAAALRPDSAAVHVDLAKSLLMQQRRDEGVAELDKYLALVPDDPAARVTRASALVDMAKYDDALAELDKAATLAPEGLHALKLRSQIYFEKKRYADAIPVLQKALALAPQDPDLPARLGHVYLDSKDYPDAVRELIAAFKMDSSSDDVLKDLLLAQYLNKNYPAALEGIDLLSKRESLPPGSWFMRATCYDKLAQPANALEAYQRFLQLNKDTNNDMYFEAAARARTLTRELKDKR
ncbi:MAG: tetratricopeptide repeat protein [Candidatus Acidiferrales bacterium]|jgi:tetratricopeptide (TPR) repeat protein